MIIDLVLVLVLGGPVVVLVLGLECLVLVLVLGLEGQVLVNITALIDTGGAVLALML